MADPKWIAFFGGSFDPPHLGHLAVAKAALQAGICDHVAWVPAFAPPHKHSSGASFADRERMIELTIADHPNMSVSRIEAELQLNPSYTFEILEAWTMRSGAPPILLIGGDSLRELHLWHRARELVAHYRIISYPRRGNTADAVELSRHWPPRTVQKLLSGMLQGDFFEISSSELKKQMEKFTEAGDIIDMGKYLAAGVCDYIIRHGLYKRLNEPDKR